MRNGNKKTVDAKKSERGRSEAPVEPTGNESAPAAPARKPYVPPYGGVQVIRKPNQAKAKTKPCCDDEESA